VPDTSQRRSALAGTAAGDLIQERADLWIKRVYGDVAEIEPPRQPNRATANNGVHALWVAPGEWLLVGEGEEIQIEAASSDLSHGRTVFRIPANAARQILAKGCPLDLHPSAFPSGSCAQSLLAKADVLIYLHEDGGRFDLYVPRSYADYLWRWLEDAGAEYGVAVSGD